MLLPLDALSRMIIDITSPGFRQLPVAVYDFVGSETGREVSGIIRDDLDYSGVFDIVSKDAYIETALPVFNPSNWTPLGVEVVVKGSTVEEGDEVKATVYVYDVVEARKILQKKYSSKKKHIRLLAHTIANDIYKKVTGHESVFTTKIAFIAKKRGKHGIFIMDWDGKRIQDTGIRANIIVSLHWSEDPWRIVYSSARGKKWGIYLVDFRKKRESLLYSPPGVNIAGDFIPGERAFLLSSSKAGTPDLYIYYLDKKKTKRLTRRRGIEISPSISPDGEEIAFVSDHTGSPQIYIMNIDGTGLRRLTYTGSYNTSPTWSPKGDRIAYVGMRGGKNQVFIIKPDGTDPIQLTEVGNNEEPSFSPDGRFIVFTSDRDGYKRVYIMRANGEGQKPLSPSRLTAFGPKWRPERR
jgi:TolB protein